MVAVQVLIPGDLEHQSGGGCQAVVRGHSNAINRETEEPLKASDQPFGLVV